MSTDKTITAAQEPNMPIDSAKKESGELSERELAQASGGTPQRIDPYK